MKIATVCFASLSLFVVGVVGCESAGEGEGEGEGEEGEGEGEGDEGEGEGEEGEGEGEGDGVVAPEITQLCETQQTCVDGGSTARFGASVEECEATLDAAIDGCPEAGDEQLAAFACIEAVVAGDCTVLDADAPPASCDDEQAAANEAAVAAQCQ